MRRIESLEEEHKILLEIAKEFHRVCVKHNIPYYMLGGTMLGAVRHGGFIPWDDDMDFGIPRRYFSEFFKIAEKEFPSHLRISTVYNSRRITGGFAKIDDTRTYMVRSLFRGEDMKIGVNIDVFPIDYADNDFSRYSKNRIISRLLQIQAYRLLSLQDRPLPKKVVALFIKAVLSPLRRGAIIDFIVKHLIVDDGPNMANHFGAWSIKEIVPREVMGTPTPYRFENIELYGVEDADRYLKSLYKDWHQLPPDGKRKIHALEIYYL